MFQRSGITSIPQLDTSNASNFQSFLRQCSKLTDVALLDFSKATYLGYLFYETTNITTLGGFKDLGKAYSKSQSANNSSSTLDLSASSLLTHESLMNVINNLFDIASIGVRPQQLVLGATNLAKLTDEEIAIATNKGWNVS